MKARTTAVTAKEFQLLEASIGDIHAALKSKRLTCRELVTLYLKRIEAYDKAGPNLNAVQTINPRALEEANRLDQTFRSSGFVGPLHCIPVLVKDQVETNDMPTTFGSVLFKDFVPQREATIVTKLKKAGALILGKSTMGEFASGYMGSAYGIIRNAYDPRRAPSGSSGGTASGIAANFATIGIAEDTGGSIRGPAAVHSLVGLRPTVPVVSRYGMMPSLPTTDTLGPITRTVKDAAILMDVIAGFDPNDPMTAYAVGQIPDSYTKWLNKEGLKGARIGVIREPMDVKADPASEDYKRFRAVMDRAVLDLKRLGAEVLDPIAVAELKDRMVKIYGNNQFETEEATDKYLAQHANAPVKTLREILISGKVVPARAATLMKNVGRSTSESAYLQLLLLKEETRQLVLTLMANNKLDALVFATFDQAPPVLTDDVLTNAKTDLVGPGNNRRLSPALGFPAITIPAGFTADNFAVGIEFLGRPFAETTLFKLAYAYEQGTHHRKPPASTPALAGESSRLE
jgi:Asp-tRNA(Asn)/Glu-tRNA(Gln) amidotransferase A subunit family amidase